MKISIKPLKEAFFDRDKVLAVVDKQTVRVMSKFGAFVRKHAQQSLRSASGTAKPSQPGRPPKSRTGLLKKHIYFAYDKEQRTVFIGPAKLNGTIGPNAAAALEHGGRSVVGTRRKQRTVSIAARPFMGPAGDFEAKHNLPKMWQDSVIK